MKNLAFIGCSLLLVFVSTDNQIQADGMVSSTGATRHVIKMVAGRKIKDIRQREGTKLVDISGRFQLAGDRVTFVPLEAPEGTSYRVLENLALERVLDNLNESRTERLWLVSGTLTEFRSVNHLLITKAVIQTQETIEPAP